MVRMQVTLEEDVHRRVHERAGASGTSVAEYIRRLISADLAGREPRATDISGLIALGNSGGSDIARHKRDYLADAVEHEVGRPTPE